MIDYSLIDFKNFKSYNIDLALKKVKKMKHYNELFELKPDVSKYKESYKKLCSNQILLKRDYKILLYYIDDIINEKSQQVYRKLYKNVEAYIPKSNNCKSFIRPLSRYIYNEFDGKESKNIFRLLKKSVINTRKNEKTEFIINLLKNTQDVDIFLRHIKAQFSDIDGDSDLDTILKRCFLTKDDKFFLNCMIKTIVLKHDDEKLIDEFMVIVNRMDLELKKEVYEGILLSYKNTPQVEKYHKKWFEKIREDLGKPYRTVNIKWEGISSEAKEVFRRWYNDENLYEFFLKISGSGDTRRLNYWRRYIDCIYDIQYFNEVDNALVMEFKQHTLVEFAKNGNAFFIYNKSIRNIEKIELYLQQGTQSKTEKTRYLKQKDFAYKRLIHSGYWEYDFDMELSRLGYKAKE